MKTKLLFLCASCLWILPAHAQLGLALAPMRVEIKVAAGGEYTDTVRLSNDSPAPVRVRADMLDWYIDDTMTPQFDDSYEQEAKLSCREWLQVNPRESQMDANGTTRVRYTLHVPAGTPEGEYHCGAGFLTLSPVSGSETPMGVRMAVRAVSTFYIIVGNPLTQPVMKDVSLKTLPDGTWEVVVLFENQGLRTFRVKGFLEVQDANGQTVERADYALIPVLPKREQQFLFPLKAPLAPGTYTLHTQADAGLPAILEGTVRVVVNAPH